jgi:phenylacetate-CoA ligase
MFSDEIKVVEKREQELLASMRAMLGISPHVKLVTPESIARSEGKAVRVIDRRKI